MTSAAQPRTKIPALFWAFAVVLALAAAVGGYIIGLNEGRTQGVAAAPSQAPAAGQVPEVESSISDVARRIDSDPLAKGAVDAPVVISEFSSFGCPYCARHNQLTEPQIINDYVDAGLVRIEWNDFPINGPGSEHAARAGRAAAEQGKFFEFKDALFADFEARGGQFTIDDFVRYAEEAGVEDLEKFRADAQSDKFDQDIVTTRAKAAELGINATPSFVIGTQQLSGALPYEDFKAVIEAELAKHA